MVNFKSPNLPGSLIVNVIEIEGLLFLGFGPMGARSMENWFFQFFPSSDVTRALKNGAL